MPLAKTFYIPNPIGGKTIPFCYRIFLLVIISNLFFSSVLGQPPKITSGQLFAELHAAQTDTARIRILFTIGNYYYENRKNVPGYLDSNFTILKQAEDLSKKIKNKTGEFTAILKRAYIYHFQYDREKENKEAAKLDDTSYIKYLIQLYEYYFYRRNLKENQDTAFTILWQAKDRAEKIGNHKLVADQYYRMAALSYYLKDFAKARIYAEEITKEFKKANTPKQGAYYWYYLGKIQDSLNPNFQEVQYCYKKAIEGYHAIKDTANEAATHKLLGDSYSNQGILDSAEIHIRIAIEMQRRIKAKLLNNSYYSMLWNCRLKGDFDQALYYCLEAIKVTEGSNNKGMGNLYSSLGIIYNDLDDNKKSLSAYLKAVEQFKKDTTRIYGTTMKGLCKALILDGRPHDALAFLKEHTKSMQGMDKVEKMCVAESFGDCYTALNQFELAEKYYLEMAQHSLSVFPSYRASSDFGMGKFYFQLKQYDKAKKYLSKSLENPQYMPPSVQAETYLLLFKTDSSSGNYQSALNHYRKYKQKKDIIFSYQKTKQVAELLIKYETEKKDKELILKDQSIQLKEKDIELLKKQSFLQTILNERRNKDLVLKEQSIYLLMQQAELNKVTSAAKDNSIKLNEKNIELLTKQAELQKAELKQANFEKGITIVGIILLLIILALLYNQYRSKQKNSKNISLKNKVLESLIKEKEWLLKEIHHRVKNNLQTVVSLLESQSSYLQNDALLAIQDSQNRVHAMSLIHQTLYQGDNVSSINMTVYIPQMVEYLKEIYSVKNIRFALQVAPIELDASQAVPVGLILNEAVTNSIKYAFDEKVVGNQISVSMIQLDEARIRFIIADNGRGIDITNEPTGLGLKLMKGLAEDLEGEFDIKNDNGTEITINFTANTLFYKQEIA